MAPFLDEDLVFRKIDQSGDLEKTLISGFNQNVLMQKVVEDIGSDPTLPGKLVFGNGMNLEGVFEFLRNHNHISFRR